MGGGGGGGGGGPVGKRWEGGGCCYARQTDNAWRRRSEDENLLSTEAHCFHAVVGEEGQEKVAMIEDGDVTWMVEEREGSAAASENGWMVVVVL